LRSTDKHQPGSLAQTSEVPVTRRATVPDGLIGTPLRRVTSDAGPVWIPAEDGVMLPFIVTYRTWEPEEGQLLTRLATSEMTFLDVGASFGYFSRLMANRFPKATIHAFEPHPTMASILRLNTWEFGERVTVWPTGLGADRGTVGLKVAANNIGDIRSSTDEGTFDIVAPLSRLDDLVRGKVDLVKIDTQGFEMDVILGMTRICQDNPAIRIVMEFWPTAIIDRRLRPADVLARYRSLGFETCLLREQQALPADDDEIIIFATGAGRDGQATLLLRRPRRD
jgi:FkbM family methyltransferase